MTNSYLKYQLFSWKWWKSWIYIIVGSFLVAASYVLFITPYNIVPGGVYGAGVVLHYLFPGIQVGTFGFMIDIPLLIMAFKVFGGMFGARTIVCSLLIPLFMNTLTYFIGEDPATMLSGSIDLSDDILLSCIFGGAIMGVGVGLIVRTRATSGGTDIIAMMIARYTNLSFARGILIVDSIVVIFGLIIFGDWRLPLYALVTLFVFTRVVDYMIDGASYDKLLFIISDRHADLENFILEEMGRGATYIKSTGMYTKKDREMVFLVVSKREVTAVRDKIKEIDPLSFLVIVDAYETYGDGFKPFVEKQ